MQIVPFTTKQTEVRVISSKIGKVVPIVDVAKAIEYEANKVRELIERNAEMFEGSVSTVTVSSHFEQRLKNGISQKRSQKFKVQALNHYGVVGLLMKLDYNRIQDEDKKAAVLRFQRWAMEVLGNKIQDTKRSYIGQFGRGSAFFSTPKVPDNAIWLDTKAVAKQLGKNKRTVLRYIHSGKLQAYRAYEGRSHKYAILVEDLSKLINKGE